MITKEIIYPSKYTNNYITILFNWKIGSFQEEVMTMHTRENRRATAPLIAAIVVLVTMITAFLSGCSETTPAILLKVSSNSTAVSNKNGTVTYEVTLINNNDVAVTGTLTDVISSNASVIGFINGNDFYNHGNTCDINLLPHEERTVRAIAMISDSQAPLSNITSHFVYEYSGNGVQGKGQEIAPDVEIIR